MNFFCSLYENFTINFHLMEFFDRILRKMKNEQKEFAKLVLGA